MFCFQFGFFFLIVFPSGAIFRLVMATHCASSLSSAGPTTALPGRSPEPAGRQPGLPKPWPNSALFDIPANPGPTRCAGTVFVWRTHFHPLCAASPGPKDMHVFVANLELARAGGERQLKARQTHSSFHGMGMRTATWPGCPKG